MPRPGPADDALSQLSLFDAPSPIEAPPPPAAPRAPSPRTPAAVPATPLPDSSEFDVMPRPPARRSELTPLTFRHPQAEREVRLGEHRVGYALRRARRSSIGFVVSAEGLQVNAPRWVSLQNIDSAVQDRKSVV